jgi:hypothetical protein
MPGDDMDEIDFERGAIALERRERTRAAFRAAAFAWQGGDLLWLQEPRNGPDE